MFAVVNKLTLGKPVDAALVTKLEQELGPRMCQSPDFIDVRLVSVSDSEAILVVLFTTREALDELSKNIAGPWFAENVMSYLSGPVQRSVGEVVSHVANRA